LLFSNGALIPLENNDFPPVDNFVITAFLAEHPEIDTTPPASSSSSSAAGGSSKIKNSRKKIIKNRR